jgi:hypothetical protein
VIGEVHSAGGGGGSSSGSGLFPREAVFVIATMLREAIINPTIRSVNEVVDGVVVVFKVLEISRRCIAFCDLMEYGFDETVGGFEAVGVIGVYAIISVVHLEG